MYSWLVTEIQSMSGTDYLVIQVIMLGAFGYLVYYCFHTFRRFRYVDGIATSRIRAAAQGLVELKGLGEWLPGDSIKSPFSDNRCVWYHCTIDQRKRSGKRTTWTNILDDCSGHLFRLVDDTGWCVVDPEHAHVIAESDVTWYGSGTDARSRKPGKTRWLHLVAGNYRFRERLIRPATELYALGEFRSFQNNPSDDYIARQVEDLVSQWKLQPARYLSDFDLDENGVIQKKEWKAIRAAAHKQVLAKLNEDDSEHHLLMRPHDSRHPFILSATLEEDLVANKKRGAYASIATAFLLLVSLVVMYSIRQPFTV